MSMIGTGSWSCNVGPGINGLTHCNLILDSLSLVVCRSTFATQHLEEPLVVSVWMLELLVICILLDDLCSVREFGS